MDKKVFGYYRDQKMYFADPHDMERAKRWGELICADGGLAYYHWKGVTYVAPIADPPLLQLIKGGRDR
jgi:hypothetical protein